VKREANARFHNTMQLSKRLALFDKFNSGGHGEGETPVPISNTAVKPFSGESSWLATARKASTLPGLILFAKPRLQMGRGFLLSGIYTWFCGGGVNP
jgi:hypothetical protein